MNLISAEPFDGVVSGSGRGRLSVAIPCYNERDNLHELHMRVGAACRKEVGDDYEIVLVNDGSSDDTWAIIDGLAQADPNMIGIDLSRNFGHQAALTAGLQACSGDRILILDADLQDPPELLGPMMEVMDRGADVVYGRRRTRAGETRAKKLTAMLFYRLLDRLIDFEIPSDTGDFRLIDRRVLAALLSMPESHRFIRGMVSWIGFRQVPIDYDRQSRFAGETHYGFGKMVNFALDAITGFSAKPLRLGVYAGIGFLALSWIGMLYSLISWLFLSTVPGWTSLIMIIMFVSGAQIFMLAIMGEYVSRTFIQTKSRPLYLVREIVGEVQSSRY